MASIRVHCTRAPQLWGILVSIHVKISLLGGVALELPFNAPREKNISDTRIQEQVQV